VSLTAGGLPKGWAEARIGDITQNIEKVDPGQQPDHVFTYLDISSISNSQQRIVQPKSYLGADAPSRARQLVRAHDILFSTVRTYLRNIAMVPSAHNCVKSAQGRTA
jgi:type I restriction enzyme, S subunit